MSRFVFTWNMKTTFVFVMMNTKYFDVRNNVCVLHRHLKHRVTLFCVTPSTELFHVDTSVFTKERLTWVWVRTTAFQFWHSWVNSFHSFRKSKCMFNRSLFGCFILYQGFTKLKTLLMKSTFDFWTCTRLFLVNSTVSEVGRTNMLITQLRV